VYNNTMADERIFNIVDAIQTLLPGSQWTIRDNDYSTLDWISTDVEKPTEIDLNAEVERLQAEYDVMNYARNRAQEYPDFKDYLDGIVKGDQEQINAYVNACLEVKAKYPKP